MNESDCAWEALAKFPVRRAMLGRQRSDAIAAVVREKMPSGNASAAVRRGMGELQIRREVEAKVREEFGNRAGFAFMTMLMLWAIGFIVQELVRRWWENRT